MEYPNHAHDIGVSDPCILPDPVTHKYYMTGSYFSLPNQPRFRKPGTISCLISEDLIHWSDPVTIFDCNGTDFWGPQGYPATELHLINGKYYLVGTGKEPESVGRPMILVSDNAAGPYTWIKNQPHGPQGWDTCDATVYVDEDNHPWLLFSHLWYESSDGQIVLQPLSDDFSECIGGPMVLFRGSDAKWADSQIWSHTDGGAIAEGPFMYKMEDGSLNMLWTGRSRTGYCTAQAKSKTGKIWGPWEQVDRPLYAHDGGHCAVFRRFDDNQLMMSLHVADAGPKMLAIFEMEERNGELHIVNELTGNWMHTVGGAAMPFRKAPCVEEPAMTRPGKLGEV